MYKENHAQAHCGNRRCWICPSRRCDRVDALRAEHGRCQVRFDEHHGGAGNSPSCCRDEADPKGDHHGHGFGGPGFGGPSSVVPDSAAGTGSSTARQRWPRQSASPRADLAKELCAGKTIAQVAKAHGVTTQKVIDALVADAKAKLAAAVKAGKLTQAQADRIQTGLTKGLTNLVNGTFPKPALRRPSRPRQGGPDSAAGTGSSMARQRWPRQSASPRLTWPRNSGRQDHRPGRQSPRRDHTKGHRRTVADAKAKLAAAVKAGKLTQAQADRIQTGLTKGITNLVNGTFPKRPSATIAGRGSDLCTTRRPRTALVIVTDSPQSRHEPPSAAAARSQPILSQDRGEAQHNRAI